MAKIKDMQHVTVEHVLALRSAAICLEQQRDELLAALENLIAANGGVKKHCGHDFCCSCAYDEAKAAISKVKGDIE